MSVQIIQDRLDRAGCQSVLEEEHALREITQEVVLAALGRTDFFLKAAFQGGTCLRIVHGLQRFSEDLDFALQLPEASFALKPYADAVARELSVYGYDLEIDDRSKSAQAVRMAFLKDDSLGKLLQLRYKPTSGPARKIRIKLEVDVNPPAGAVLDTRYLDFPFPTAMRVFDLPSLFAGKVHALLCREFQKGRDWYDFIWYTARRTPINYSLLSASLRQAGPWRGLTKPVDRNWCIQQLRERIQIADWRHIRDDVRRFLKSQEWSSLDTWNAPFFLGQCDKIV